MKVTLMAKTRSRRILAFTVFGLLLAVFIGAARMSAQTPSGKDVVAPTAYVSLDPAGRGSTARIAVVMKIRPGFHVNAREKSAEYLIATDLKSDLPAWFSGGEVAYPKGKLEKFVFSKTPLNVYQDTVVLKMPLKVLASAPSGEHHIPMKLRYQACSQEICLPPTTLDIDAVVNVGSASKPAHREIFAAQK
jgi:thiol:disulfide interchange protein DsbD